MSAELISLLGVAAALLVGAGFVIYQRAPVELRAADVLRGTTRREGRDLRTLVEDTPFGRRIDADIRRAGMTTRASTLILMSLVLLIIVSQILPFVVALIVAAIPYIVVRRRAGRHAKEFAVQLPAVLDLLASALRAGQSEAQAFALVGEQTKGAAGQEFRRMHQALGLGATVESVTTGLLERLPGPDLELVVDAIQLAHRVGGNLADMLAGIATTIRNRTRLQGEVAALTAQGRASVLLVTALAPVGLLLISFINPAWGNTLFNTTPGRIVLGLAAILEVLGYFTSRQAAAVEV